MDTLPRVALAVAAWLISIACMFVSSRRVRKFAQLAPPAPSEVLARLRAQPSAAEKSVMRAELAEARSDAERLLALGELWPRSFARIALASGTALAVTSLAKGLGTGGSGLAGGSVEFLGGFVGMAVCSTFGREAKQQAGDLRRRWRDTAKAAARE